MFYAIELWLNGQFGRHLWSSHLELRMSPLAIVLVLASALIHAAWNATGKSQAPSTAFFSTSLGAGLLAMSPLLIFYGDVMRIIPFELWMLIALTGMCQAMYYGMLAAAYRSGDISLTYPLTRSTTVLFMAGAASTAQLSGQFSGVYVAGLGFITGGSLMLPLRSSADLRIARYCSKSCLFAVLAAAGTTGCMLIDQRVLSQMATLPHSLSIIETLLMYAPLQSFSAVTWLLVWTACNRAERVQFFQIMRENKKRAALVGLGIYASYGLLLASTPYVHDLSYSVALRQVSIPVGMGIGIVLLKEPHYLLKSFGAAAITAGVVLVALA
jgi:drug/metabolite transporter (DMT)-like permease